MIVYLDAYFLLNTLMNYGVLDTEKRVLEYKVKRWRLLTASIIGGIYATANLLAEGKLNNVLGVLAFALVCCAMNLIAFGGKRMRDTLTNFLMTYVSAFVLSSLLLRVNKYYRLDSFAKILVVLIICKEAVELVFRFIIKENVLKRNSKDNEIYTQIINNNFKVLVKKGDKSVASKAIVDTGNSLSTPITNKPVAVISRELLEKMKANKMLDLNEGVVVIPYSSVGNEAGVLYGFCVDSIEIVDKKNEDGGIMRIATPTLAVYNREFYDKRKYEMLLHPKMIKGAMKYVD